MVSLLKISLILRGKHNYPLDHPPSWKNGFAHVELKGCNYLSQKSVTKTEVRYYISFWLRSIVADPAVSIKNTTNQILGQIKHQHDQWAYKQKACPKTYAYTTFHLHTKKKYKSNSEVKIQTAYNCKFKVQNNNSRLTFRKDWRWKVKRSLIGNLPFVCQYATSVSKASQS